MPERAIPSIGITTSAKLRLPHAVDLPQPVVVGEVQDRPWDSTQTKERASDAKLGSILDRRHAKILAKYLGEVAGGVEPAGFGNSRDREVRFAEHVLHMIEPNPQDFRKDCSPDGFAEFDFQSSPGNTHGLGHVVDREISGPIAMNKAQGGADFRTIEDFSRRSSGEH
jgi:hypothetical protein